MFPIFIYPQIQATNPYMFNGYFEVAIEADVVQLQIVGQFAASEAPQEQFLRSREIETVLRERVTQVVSLHLKDIQELDVHCFQELVFLSWEQIIASFSELDEELYEDLSLVMMLIPVDDSSEYFALLSSTGVEQLWGGLSSEELETALGPEEAYLNMSELKWFPIIKEHPFYSDKGLPEEPCGTLVLRRIPEGLIFSSSGQLSSKKIQRFFHREIESKRLM